MTGRLKNVSSRTRAARAGTQNQILRHSNSGSRLSALTRYGRDDSKSVWTA